MLAGRHRQINFENRTPVGHISFGRVNSYKSGEAV